MTSKRCIYCNCLLRRGSYITAIERGRFVGYYCRSEWRCYNRLLAQVQVLARTGNRLRDALLQVSKSTGLTGCEDVARVWDGAKEGVGL